MTIDKLLPIEIFALTLYGEARGEPIEGQIAVANVIMNRLMSVAKYRDVKDVCLEPKQFSCWNESDPNRTKLLKIAEQFITQVTDRYLKQAMYIAQGAMGGHFIDNTKGARNYMTTSLFYSHNRPDWAKIPKDDPIEIGNHTFFLV